MSLRSLIVDKNLLIRRINIVANHVTDEADAQIKVQYEQLDLLTDYEKLERERREEEQTRKKEHKMQQAIIDIKKKYGKNAVIKGMNLQGRLSENR